MPIYAFFCSIDEPSPGSFEPSLRRYAIRGAAVDGRVDPTVGTGEMFILAELDAAGYAAASADPDMEEIFPLEGLTLDSPINSLTNPQIAAAKAVLEARHVPHDQLSGSDTIRRGLRHIIIRFVIRQLLKDLDLTEGLDTLVSAIPQARRANIKARLQSYGFDPSVLDGSMTVRQALLALKDQKNTIAEVKKWLKTHLDT